MKLTNIKLGLKVFLSKDEKGIRKDYPDTKTQLGFFSGESQARVYDTVEEYLAEHPESESVNIGFFKETDVSSGVIQIEEKVLSYYRERTGRRKSTLRNVKLTTFQGTYTWEAAKI